MIMWGMAVTVVVLGIVQRHKTVGGEMAVAVMAVGFAAMPLAILPGREKVFAVAAVVCDLWMCEPDVMKGVQAPCR